MYFLVFVVYLLVVSVWFHALSGVMCKCSSLPCVCVCVCVCSVCVCVSSVAVVMGMLSVTLPPPPPAQILNKFFLCSPYFTRCFPQNYHKIKKKKKEIIIFLLIHVRKIFHYKTAIFSSRCEHCSSISLMDVM